MFQETPIYTRLITERGDVPAMVRGEADRIHRDLERVTGYSPVLAPHHSFRSIAPAPNH
ncbi:hypothetical protein OIB37_01710 [Streptomyces sp. NBC_00820]|uniref:hypothetical protein n=1 Tax=Streptomyces sp. NBC_00820 TaxID=2975842 RepID=UPI002ED424BD|nr:hypothetical protein OIB37_01710 [Streptomyces sp. NBC_00820]